MYQIVLLVLIQTCNAGARGLLGRSETSSRCNGGLMAFSAGAHIIHNLATSYPQDIYAQAAHDRQNIKEFSFDKNRMKSYKYLKMKKKKMFKKLVLGVAAGG